MGQQLGLGKLLFICVEQSNNWRDPYDNWREHMTTACTDWIKLLRTHFVTRFWNPLITFIPEFVTSNSNWLHVFVASCDELGRRFPYLFSTRWRHYPVNNASLGGKLHLVAGSLQQSSVWDSLSQTITCDPLLWQFEADLDLHPSMKRNTAHTKLHSN